MGTNLYVGSISYQSREDDLRATSVEMADEKAAPNVISRDLYGRWHRA